MVFDQWTAGLLVYLSRDSVTRITSILYTFYEHESPEIELIIHYEYSKLFLMIATAHFISTSYIANMQGFSKMDTV